MNWIEVTVCTVPEKLDGLCENLENADFQHLKLRLYEINRS